MYSCIALEGRDAMRVRAYLAVYRSPALLSGPPTLNDIHQIFTAKLKSGPRRQFGPRRSPERFWGFHRVIGPIRPYGNTHLHLGRSFGKTGYVVNGNFCCINRYTRTRIASRPSRAIQLYIAIHRYTLYSYASLYSIQALQHPSGDEMLAQEARVARESMPAAATKRQRGVPTDRAAAYEEQRTKK